MLVEYVMLGLQLTAACNKFQIIIYTLHIWSFGMWLCIVWCYPSTFRAMGSLWTRQSRLSTLLYPLSHSTSSCFSYPKDGNSRFVENNSHHLPEDISHISKYHNLTIPQHENFKYDA
jgi:hypothetical protein